MTVLIQQHVDKNVLAGFTSTQMSGHKANGITGYVFYGGVTNFTTQADADAQAAIVAPAITRAHALGMTVGMRINVGHYNNGSTPFAPWFDDDNVVAAGKSGIKWTFDYVDPVNAEQRPSVITIWKRILGAYFAVGLDEIMFDQEEYSGAHTAALDALRPGSDQFNGEDGNWSWRWDWLADPIEGNKNPSFAHLNIPANGGRYTQAEVKAKARERGKQWMQAALSVWPNIKMSSYYCRLAGGQWEVQYLAVPGQTSNPYMTRSVMPDFWGGLLSVVGLQRYRHCEFGFYKTGGTSTPGSWDANLAANNANLRNTYLGLSEIPDYLAPRMAIGAFPWGDQTAAIGENAPYMGDSFVLEQYKACARFAQGGILDSYGHRFDATTGHWTATELFAATNAAKTQTPQAIPSYVPPATGPPSVTTAPANPIGQTTASLNGSVNPNGFATTAQFEYGPTTSYGTLTAVQVLGNGQATLGVTAALTGLAAGATYHFRLRAVNSSGTTLSADGSFTTAGIGVPILTVNPVSGVGQTAATLSGTVDPQGAATTAHFDYGTTTAYGSSTPTVNMGSGTGAVAISQALSGLSSATTYHYRLVAANAGGQAASSDASFATALAPPPNTTYSNLVLSTPGLVSYWRLDESSGVAIDAFGVNVGSPSGGVTRLVTGIPGSEGDQAIRFDGITGYVNVPHASTLNLGDGPYSLEAWFKRNAVDRMEAIMDKGSGAYHLYIDSDNLIKAGRSGFAWGVQSSVTITNTSLWHHVFVTYTGTQWALWLDGVDRTGATADLALTDVTTPLGIGNTAVGTPHPLSADVDEVAIYNAAVSPSLILQHWQFGSSTSSKIVAVGQVQETDFAQDTSRVGGSIIGAAPFLVRKAAGGSRTKGPDRLRAATSRAVIRVNVGQLSEIDLGQPMKARKTKVLGQPVEADLAQPRVKGHVVVMGLTTEADSVRIITHPGHLSMVGDVSDAQPIISRKTVKVGQVVGG